MKNMRTFLPGLLIALLLFVGLLTGPILDTAQGAPVAVPTPITQYNWNPQPKTLEFFAGETSLTEDTRSTCHNIAGYSTLDLHYVIDQGTVNTTTVTLEFSNIADNYPDGVAVVTANAADSADIKQFNLFGSQVCLYADVTNSNAWEITAVGLAK